MNEKICSPKNVKNQTAFLKLCFLEYNYTISLKKVLNICGKSTY